MFTERVTHSAALGEGLEESTTIVLVEDDKANAGAVIEALSAVDGALRVQHVERLSDALVQVAAGSVDAVMLDLPLPDATGLTGLTRLRSEAPEVPVLVLTSSHDERLCAQALHGGAQDCLVKGDLDAPDVARRIRDAARRQRYVLAHRAALALENARLHRELRMAVAVREEFLSIAAHELRTPLTTALMQLQLLQRVSGSSLPAAELDKRIDAACTQTVRIARLVDRLFDISLISSGQLALRFERLDLGEVVQDTVSLFLEEQTAVPAPVVFERGEEVVGDFDRLRLEQVVTNLIVNGIRYGLGTEVRVRLRAEDGARAILTVSDGGMGIPSSDLDVIFDRFERGTDGRSKSGLGLGLYLTRQIVEAHGGTIVAASEPGRGSIFTVTLPLGSA